MYFYSDFPVAMQDAVISAQFSVLFNYYMGITTTGVYKSLILTSDLV